jgi:hypothetical protein
LIPPEPFQVRIVSRITFEVASEGGLEAEPRKRRNSEKQAGKRGIPASNSCDFVTPP